MSDTATILGPDGIPARRLHSPLTDEEAALLRRYKQFKARRGFKDALYCDACWDGDPNNKVEGYVSDEKIVLDCRCTVRTHGVTG